MKHLTLIALMMTLAGCGGASQTETDNTGSSDNTPTSDNTAPVEFHPENVGVEQTEAPGTDPVLSRTYTNTYGNNFCDNQPSDLQCWGDIDFHAGTAVTKLLMGRDAICYAATGFANGVDCYSATLGPITMNAHKVTGVQNSELQTFTNVTVNVSGQVCFKVSEWHNGSIHAIYNVCGFAPQADGSIQ